LSKIPIVNYKIFLFFRSRRGQITGM